MSDRNDKRCALNRRVLSMLIHSLKEAGWEAVCADDEVIKGQTIEQQVETVFNLDGADISFSNGTRGAGVRFIPYNCGSECIGDWTINHKDFDEVVSGESDKDLTVQYL
jgi:hypothetical protein